jgi:hypothetical protein
VRSGETNIMTIVKTVTGFDASNVSWGRWGILNKGKADHYVIGKPGAFGPRRFDSPTRVTTPYQTILQVWQRYKDDGVTMENLETNVDAIIAAFDAKRNLGDTSGEIVRADLRRGSEAQEMWKGRGGGPLWLKIDLIIEWETKEIITFA